MKGPLVACAHPGCSGKIEDGYCDTCGLAPAGAAANKAPVAATVPTTAATPSTRTGSARTPSTRSGRSSRSTRSTRTGSNRTARSTTRTAGTRLLARAPLPPLDPLASIVPGVVPERKRFCSNCDANLKRDSGFCPKCGQEYSFLPSLSPGDVVADKYEIKGTIAFGGLGWIYLALDKILNRWVILKGLLNSKDPHMLEVAVQEREYLAAVKHPNIVGIYDFVTHARPGKSPEGFIVMEYVNGKTLMTLRKERNGPIPVAEAVSYIAEILPAFGYLDELGLVYCDFKPENVMVEEDTVKLIDLGAVRRVDAVGGDIYGSKGYTAPEAHDAPSPLSDLYSVGRALAVLIASFDFQKKYEHALPPLEEVPIFAEHEPLYRFLVKATRSSPEDRFGSAAEMLEQLVGVLHGIVGESGDLGRFESALFEADSDRLASDSARYTQDGIPRLKVDREDAAASIILAAGAVGDPRRRLQMFERALVTYPNSVELKLRKLDELVNLGKVSEAESLLGLVQAEARAQKNGMAPNDWRLAWYRGRALLAQGKWKDTVAAFRAIVDELPGELAPRQALGRAYEAEGSLDRAIEYYDAVSRADPQFVTAAIGLARCYEQKKDRAAAAAAYRRVPGSSNRFTHAQMALARLLVGDLGLRPGESATFADVAAAARAVEAVEAEGLEYHRLRADVFRAGARALKSRKPGEGEPLLGVECGEAPFRLAAEAELRTCAKFAKSDPERFALVDLANQVRPVTWT
jgi:serine/threonine-protein kinase PknG